VVVGDDQQLPATVLSPTAATMGYRRSLLERLRNGGADVMMLQTQYRMHPDISSFPSRHFYHGLLKVGSVQSVPVSVYACVPFLAVVDELSTGSFVALAV